MGSKRSRKAAAARKRAAQASAEAAKKSKSIPVPMLVCAPLSLEVEKSDAWTEFQITGNAIHAAMFSAGEIGGFDDSGKRIASFASARGLDRLSNEELRLSADVAMAAVGKAVDHRKFRGYGFDCDAKPVRDVTSAVAAARFAFKSCNPVEGLASNMEEAHEIADDFCGSMWVSTLARGEDERKTSYVFFPYSGERAARHDEELNTPEDPVFRQQCSSDGSEVDRLEEIAQAVTNRFDTNSSSIPRGFPTLEPFALPPTPGRERRRGVANLEGLIDDDDNDDDDDDDDDVEEVVVDATLANTTFVNEGKSLESNESDDKKEDGPGTPSGSSLWSSFGRLFNFGRCPENGPQNCDRVGEDSRRICAVNVPDFVNTSPTTPGHAANCMESFMMSNSGDQFCQHSSASEEDGGHQPLFRTGSVGSRSGPRRARRVLRAARTLKQPPSSPSTPDVGVADLSALLADTNIGKSGTTNATTVSTKPKAQAKSNVGACPTHGSSWAQDAEATHSQADDGVPSSTKRTKKVAKTKRRPRVRLVEEDSENR